MEIGLEVIIKETTLTLIINLNIKHLITKGLGIMANYRVGDLMILNTRPAGITRGDWMITVIAGPDKTGGPIYTLRNSANNTETTSVNTYELDTCYHFKFPRKTR